MEEKNESTPLSSGKRAAVADCHCIVIVVIANVLKLNWQSGTGTAAEKNALWLWRCSSLPDGCDSGEVHGPIATLLDRR